MANMEFTDYLLYKAVAVIVVVAIYGFYLGITGR